MKKHIMKALLSIVIIATTLLAHAGGGFSLIEINPLHGNSQLTPLSDSAKTYYGAGALSGFIEMDGKLYFTAQSSPGDNELWVTDGTAQGTNLVKEINPAQNAAIGNLVNVNNHILFLATDNGSGWDLWSTDGSGPGTVKIDPLNAPSNKALGSYNISVMDNKLVFCAQNKVLISDGTAAGTDSLLSIANYSQGFGYCELNNFVYFVLPEIDGANEIWRTDGTATGTQKILDLSSTPFGIDSAKEVVSFNGKIYLTATDNTNSTELFSFDGAIDGQLTRVSINPGNISNIRSLNKYNNVLYFIANSGAYSNLYRLSETDATPVPLIPNTSISSLSNLTFANNTAYCMEPGGNKIHAVELSGFNYSVLTLSQYHLPNYVYTEDPFLLGIGQQIFFEAYDNTSNNQLLIQSDFTISGTKPVMPVSATTPHPFNCHLKNGIQDVFDLKLWNNKIIMPANFNDAGRELWIFDPATATAVNGLNSAAQTFAVFPNPASNELNISASGNVIDGQIINIESASGQLVISKMLNKGTATIKLSSLAAGNYFVTLFDGNKPLGTRQFILTK